MEYLDGLSLAAASEKRPMPMPRLLHIARQIASGLAAAHLAGIVHRDLKPDNVMVVNRGADRDFVKILDFGIAKVGAEPKITRAGAVFRTPNYMSPEQAAGAPVDKRTDINMRWGSSSTSSPAARSPFDADNFRWILTQHMYKQPLPIPRDRAAARRGAGGVRCGGAVGASRSKPEQRYGAMDALLADLEKVEKGLVPDAVPDMMARSGGFNVPADYFRQARGMPDLVPGMPRRGPRGALGGLRGVAGIVTAVGLVLLILVRSATTHATPPAAAALAGNALAAADPGASVNGGSVAPVNAPPAASAPEASEVLLSVEPPDAKVTRDGATSGRCRPRSASRAGETASLVVTRAG